VQVHVQKPFWNYHIEWNSIKLQQIPCAITEFHANIAPFEIYFLYTVKLILASYCAVFYFWTITTVAANFLDNGDLMRNGEILWQPF